MKTKIIWKKILKSGKIYKCKSYKFNHSNLFIISLGNKNTKEKIIENKLQELLKLPMYDITVFNALLREVYERYDWRISGNYGW